VPVRWAIQPEFDDSGRRLWATFHDGKVFAHGLRLGEPGGDEALPKWCATGAVVGEGPRLLKVFAVGSGWGTENL
jgi:hypothetical protein